MTVMIQIAPDEETPLLGSRHVSIPKRTVEPESEAATLAGPSNHTSRTSSIGGKTNVNGRLEVVKKTPLPWAQFSIILFLQLAEPLTMQVISPVSFRSDFLLVFLLWPRFTPTEGAYDN